MIPLLLNLQWDRDFKMTMQEKIDRAIVRTKIPRVSREEILDLMQNASLRELGERAFGIKQVLHPDNITTFVVDRNINYTNICWVDCKFCAFKRRINESETYILSFEEIDQKIDGYLWNKESHEFTIDENSELRTDSEYGIIFDTEFSNMPVKGKVVINKVGEVAELVEGISGYEGKH